MGGGFSMSKIKGLEYRVGFMGVYSAFAGIDTGIASNQYNDGKYGPAIVSFCVGSLMAYLAYYKYVQIKADNQKTEKTKPA